jgi:hypothetical protein
MRAQGQADPDLSRPLAYREGDHAVDADRNQQERQNGKDFEQKNDKAVTAIGVVTT